MRAEIEFDAGDIGRAAELAGDVLEIFRRIGSSAGEMYVLCNLATYRLLLGDTGAAEAAARTALLLARAREILVVTLAVQVLAAVAARHGRSLRAARLLGYVDAWCRREEYLRDATEQKGYDALLVSLREQLSEGEIAALAAEGAQLTEEAAVDEALDV